MQRVEIAIIDDEVGIRESYCRYVETWAKQREFSLKVSQYESAEEFWFAYQDKKDFSALLMDIEMKGMSGVELAQVIRQSDSKVPIIFISGYSEYIGKGYDVEALHFLVKPIAEEKLQEVLDKAIRWQQGRKQSIILRESDRLSRVYLEQILYLQSDKNYLDVIGFDFSYHVRGTLTEMEQMLDKRFFRLSRSELINLDYVERFGKTEVCMRNGTCFPVPRGKFAEMNQAMIEYF